MEALLLEWPYQVGNKNKLSVDIDIIKRDYELIKKMNNFSNQNHPLYNELFVKQDGKLIPAQKLRIAKDFNIKNSVYIKKLRKYHEKVTRTLFL